MRWRVSESELEEVNDNRSGELIQDIHFDDLTEYEDRHDEEIASLDELEKPKRESYAVKVRRSIEDYHERRRLRKDLDIADDSKDILD